MLNKQGPGKIDWTDWTWNPISGCKHGCPYCYMLRMEKRFPGIMKPEFRPDHLEKIKRVRKVKPGDKIFVGSSGDMWGEWVPQKWIDQVLVAAGMREQVTFQFLTKNPKRYADFAPLKNAWYGTTVDGTPRTMKNLDDLTRATTGAWNRFVSFEPLIELPSLHDRSNIFLLDWIIIGADSTKGADRPPKEWAEILIRDAREYDIPVFVKDNYGYPERIKEFPLNNR